MTPRLFCIALAVLLLAAEPALAQSASEGWAGLALEVVDAAARLGLVVPIIGLIVLGAALAFGLSLAPMINVIVGGALLVLGATIITTLFGI